MDEKNLKEKDFQRYTGWKIPFIIKLAWLGLSIWIITYLAVYMVPSLLEWKE